ncbi:helix-turn-helix domain containing protein [Rhizobium sp. BR 317]|uniref:TetR/AcrR family transcriptional regulator n=1 Tax=Rhizobium sp. BR 317 TaxID=3040015 RepID=UPI0039BFDA1D
MIGRKPGRPADGKTIAKDAILADALALLSSEGVEGLTMRALAARVGITPMTIYHRFGDRDGLIRELAELVYAGVTVPTTGDVLARAQDLLVAYHAKVLLHPSLTLAIFARPALFPAEARRITETLISLLRESGLSSEQALRWAYVLIDYAHGAALAMAAQSVGEQLEDGNAAGPHGFELGLAELLDALRRRRNDL